MENKFEEYQSLIAKQRAFFDTGITRTYNYRYQALLRLKKCIQELEPEIEEALFEDLGKGPFETYFGEIGGVYAEIDYQLKHLRRWMKPKRVSTPIALFPAKSEILYEPYGTVLIMSPWNYPFQLAIMPLIGALAAGNTVIIKPSEFSTATSAIIEKIVALMFQEEYVAVVQGEVPETTELLKQRFDLIFFTGSTGVGKIVMSAAAKHLTPVVLELGGKSPVIIDETANMDVALRRLGFGKISNCGQTCVAPDYLLIHESRKEEFLEGFNKMLQAFFEGNDLSKLDSLKPMARVINKKNYDRLVSLFESENVVIGGHHFDDALKISPTVVDCGSLKDYLDGKEKTKILEEEIFGPILPFMTYSKLSDVITYVNQNEKPLALYVFSEDKNHQKQIVDSVSFGGGCINDTLVHLANENLPFGGVGNSGMGSYHGRKSFETFSHNKSLIVNNTWMDIKVRYMPYTDTKYKLLRKLYK